MQFDLPLEELKDYRPDLAGIEAADFDAFWARTLDAAEAQKAPLKLEPAPSPLTHLDVFDLTFSGFGGAPVKGWLMRPKDAGAPLPLVVEFLGYGGGRGRAEEHLFWANVGFAHVVMDNRGQGSGWGGGPGGAGATGDEAPPGDGPHVPGMVTRGILRPETSYFRRLFTDAVRLVRDLENVPFLDPARRAVLGASQGGAIAQAVSAFETLAAACIDVPFLTNVPRSVTLTDDDPYFEIVRYLRAHRTAERAVFETLSYFDGLSFAARAKAPALYSVALMDTVCPPSSGFAAYNHHPGLKDIAVYPFAHHEGGGIDHRLSQAGFLMERLAVGD
ncbi:MAG: acetylxylan esterase [Paracoccaceae bacterium]|nr:acetylxylan esterase [Paracoccaceae bacterium]